MSNPNPFFIIIPATSGGYDTRLITNGAESPVNTSQVVNPAKFGFYAFSTIGASRSTVPPANYPAVGQ